MNKIYKLKFDKRRNELVVVSEITAGMGKEKSTGHLADLRALSPFRQLSGTLTPLVLLTGLIISLFPGMTLAADLPAGGQIVGGQGSISTSGNQMTIHQQTQNMATNWHSFDVGQNNTVQFVQPDSSSVALNRVTGASGSQIMGTLKANGQVFILNPNGVLFGKDARVNVAGLVASTKNINTADFMKGQYTLSGEGNPGAQVVNQGSLTTSKGGYIVLSGERVSNGGTITTPSGKTVLAAGRTVTLQLDNGGLTAVSVDGSVVNALVENSGLISASSGQVYLTAKGQDMLLNTVVNNSGSIEAKGLESRGGEIVLNGGDSGVVSQSGQLLADSHGGRGGKITLEGENIHLAAGSKTSATGRSGGGEVYVGGGWQGKDSHIRNASKVVMDKSATVDVSATESGNGGTAVLWSDDYTNFRGSVLARGGAQSGDGGRVETSSHRNLQAFGAVDASARAGHGGEWLLDPLNVTIVNGTENTSVAESGQGTDAVLDNDSGHVFSPSEAGAQISAQKIADQLNAGTDVTVDTHGDGSQEGNITFADNVAIRKTAGNTASLTLKADKDIVAGNRASITATEGRLNLNLLVGGGGQGGQVSFGNWPDISLNGGDVFVGPANTAGGNAGMTFSNSGSIRAGNITLNTKGGTTGKFYTLNATENLTVTGPLTVEAGYKITSEIKAGHLLDITADSGDISFAATKVSGGDAAGGKIMIEGKDGVNIRTSKGHLVMNVADTNQNTINVSSSEGPVVLDGRVQDATTGLSLTNVTVSSGGKTTLDGGTGWGNGAVLSGLGVTAKGDINISGVAPGHASSNGLKMDGSTVRSEGGDVSLSGSSGTDPRNPSNGGMTVNNSNITASGKIRLNGTTESTTGLNVTGSSFTAASLEVKGVATKNGTGFSLKNSHLLNGLADLSNVTFSSAGSAAGVTNLLDKSIVTAENRNSLMDRWHPENMTRIDLQNTPVFNNAEAGWVGDYSSEEHPAGGWLFANTSVTAGGDVNLKGVGFTDSVITVSKGGLIIDNGGSAILNGTTINVPDGGVDINSTAGNIDLSKGSINAKNDITLKATSGEVSIGGTTEIKDITSLTGNISVSGNTAGKTSTDGVLIRKARLTASGGNIDVSGNGGRGVILNDVTLSAVKGNISVFGQGGIIYEYYKQFGAVTLSGNSTFNALKTLIHGVHNRKADDYFNVGIFIGGNLNFQGGDTSILGEAVNGNGIVWQFNPGGAGDVTTHKMDISSESFNLEGRGAQLYHTAWPNSGIGFNQFDGTTVKVVFNLSDSTDFNMSGIGAGGAAGLLTDTALSTQSKNSYIFKGDGNVRLLGKSDRNSGLILRGIDNTELRGQMTITGESNSGLGLDFSNYLDTSLRNAIIKGKSSSRAGVRITAVKGMVNLNANRVSGSTSTGQGGIILSGSNVIITNGTMNGEVTAGNGAGVSMSGGSNYTLDGASVTGTAVDGSGISVNGTLTVNNGTTLVGIASGSGNGVVVSGNLSTDSGDGVTLSGTASSGDGVVVSGVTTLANATLKGQTDSGNGVNITGNLTTDSATIVQGIAGSGTGVTLGAALTGATVDGKSEQGTGLQLADNAKVTRAEVSGKSAIGTGVSVKGKVSLDDESANRLKANSESGSGLTLSEGADLHILQSGTATPVTTATILEGTSKTGSGVTVAGNAAVSGVILRGNTTAENGTGVTLKNGKLTLSDNLSGIEASATGNGTALVLENAGVDAKGYRESEGEDKSKDYTLSATTNGDGTAVRVSGESALTSVKLDATSTGNGSALAVEAGMLKSDRDITASSSGDTGTSVVLQGGNLQGAGDASVTVEAIASGEHGTAMKVEKAASAEGDTASSSLGNINLQASSDKGTVLDVSGDLSSDRDISVSTTDGTALVLNGGGLTSTDKANPVTITASATGDTGTAVNVEEAGTASSLKDVHLTSSSTDGDALNVAGRLDTQNAVLKASATGAGTALNVGGGEIHSQGQTSLTATADAGHAAVITDGKLTGEGNDALVLSAITASANPAVDISGHSEISHSSVKGENKGTGTAVKQSGHTT
ncbi:TPA: filamentous hemagglutinin N-terminal domain-containing protein, partial [Salmonella enterica subsp. enterica serovar Muenchen]